MKKVGFYKLEEKLGSGAYGTVFRATHIKTKKNFAVKMMQKKALGKKLQEYLEREVNIIQMIDHPNVIKLLDLQKTENNYYLIFEYCNGGDLEKYKKRCGRVLESNVRAFGIQVANGLDALHEKKAIHRDLKLANILLHYPNREAYKNDKPILKIGDFGFARLVMEQQAEEEGGEKSISEFAAEMSIVGTPLHMAPELFHKQAYSFKADIWSLGTILFQMLTGYTPFSGINKDNLVKNIDKGNYKFPPQLELSIDCITFINKCLQYDPANRFSWKELMAHPFFSPEISTRESAKLCLDASGIYMHEELSKESSPGKRLGPDNAIMLNCHNYCSFYDSEEKKGHDFKKALKRVITKEDKQLQRDELTQLNDLTEIQEQEDEQEESKQSISPSKGLRGGELPLISEVPQRSEAVTLRPQEESKQTNGKEFSIGSYYVVDRAEAHEELPLPSKIFLFYFSNPF